jgi:rubrerythrin
MEGVDMLDRGEVEAAPGSDYVQFLTAGNRVLGAYHCSECAYGVTVRGLLPPCPMCGGTSWEPAAWSPFAGRRDPAS